MIALTLLGGTSAAAVTTSQPDAAQAASAQRVDAAGAFTTVVDFSSLATRDVGTSKCEFQVSPMALLRRPAHPPPHHDSAVKWLTRRRRNSSTAERPDPRAFLPHEHMGKDSSPAGRSRGGSTGSMTLSQKVRSSGAVLPSGAPQTSARLVASHAAVAEYIASLDADGSLGRVVEVTRFMRGENHAVYRVRCVDQCDLERDVVVRISNADSEADRAQAGREAAVLAHLRGAASPRLIDYRTGGPFAGHAVMCLEYVDGSVEPLDTASPDRLADLGAVVRRTHAIPVDDLAPVLHAAPDLSVYVENRGRSMLARMPLVQDPMPEEVQRRFRDVAAWAKQAIDQLRTAEDAGIPVLLHGDVSAGNVLWTPRPVLIDWEYARIGDPADEIGYVFGQNALRPEQREGFWRGYGAELEPASLGRVVERAASWEPLTLFGSALYWVDLWSRRMRAEGTGSVDPSAPKDPSYYLEHATRYLDRIGSAT